MNNLKNTIKSIADTFSNCKVGKITSVGKLKHKEQVVIIEFHKEDFKISIDEFMMGKMVLIQ